MFLIFLGCITNSLQTCNDWPLSLSVGTLTVDSGQTASRLSPRWQVSMSDISAAEEQGPPENTRMVKRSSSSSACVRVHMCACTSVCVCVWPYTQENTVILFSSPANGMELTPEWTCHRRHIAFSAPVITLHPNTPPPPPWVRLCTCVSVQERVRACACRCSWACLLLVECVFSLRACVHVC